jgi:DNA-binding MarR family transcriptional regulator
VKSNVQNPDNVLFQFFRTGQAVRLVMREIVEDTGITGEEYGVLGVIGLLGPISPTELARRTGVPPTSLSRYIANFVERGYARRLPNAEDGRSYLVEGTAKGRRVVETIAPRIATAVEDLKQHSEIELPRITEALSELEDAARSLAKKRARHSSTR